jgi:futalosine hydrolase
MRILAVAATKLEIPILDSGRRASHHVDVLVTGVGMVATAARVAQALARTSYDAALNFGVCGSFSRTYALGDVVHVTSDALSELGVEDGDCFLTMHELGLAPEASIDNAAPAFADLLADLPVVRAITVNTVHGNEASIAAVVQRLSPDVESMEGAAFAYACALSAVPYAQVRAISNLVERRNRDAWRMDLAVRNLNRAALRILDHACA